MIYLDLVRPVKALVLIVAFVGAAPFCFAQTSDSSSSSGAARVKALAMHAPAPQYPVDAQGRRPTGQGVVLMHVDKKTGRVISAKMQQSTGNKFLDDAAIAAFSQWRFRPGTAAYIRSPITFVGNTQARPNNALPTPTPCPVCPSRD